MLLEACANSAMSAIEAQLGGADRVELCENMADGGCTPGIGSFRYARNHISIPIFVMIRPRGADFLYSEAEFDVMKSDIRMVKELGAEGVVFGVLKPEGNIDKERMRVLIDLARPMGITFHRAFDVTRDPFEALDDLIGLGIDRVLTSGQTDHVLDGAPLIRKLIDQAQNRIIIMPGHGVKEYNLQQVIQETGAQEFHVYLTKRIKSRMDFRRRGVMMGKPDASEYEYIQVDAARIRQARQIIHQSERINL